MRQNTSTNRQPENQIARLREQDEASTSGWRSFLLCTYVEDGRAQHQYTEEQLARYTKAIAPNKQFKENFRWYFFHPLSFTYPLLSFTSLSTYRNW